MNDSQFPWIILVPMRDSVTESFLLEATDQLQLHQESMALAALLMDHFKGDKLNTAALGNVVSQLHVHHIVRFKTDRVWPKPVWGNIPATPYNNQQLERICGELKTLFNSHLKNYKAY